MLTLFVVALISETASEAARAKLICEVGRIALSELPVDVDAERYDLGYAYPNARRPDLLDACPELARELPANIPLADVEKRRRAGVHAPIPGEVTPLTKVFSVGLPVLSADVKTADVQLSYECTGLCGGGFIAVYTRSGSTWRRTGSRDLWVS